MSKAVEYDHVAGDRDEMAGPDCDLCGENGPAMDLKPCCDDRCDMVVCCDCRAKNEAYAELGVCSENCAVLVINKMRAEIKQLREANACMVAALEFIRSMKPEKDYPDQDRKTLYAYALGTAQGRAIHAAIWGKVA